MKIKKKIDVNNLINNFDKLANYDSEGKKFYVFYTNEDTGLTTTIMKYSDGLLTKHSKSETYFDENEVELTLDSAIDIVYKDRKWINKVLV